MDKLNICRGFFITLEGMEGAGKTSSAKFIEEYFLKNKIDFIMTHEPGGTEIAEKIRKVLLAHYSEKMTSFTELFLYFAGRAQHFEQVIMPALKLGKCVISDRFTDASFAYQGAGRGIPYKHIKTLENWVQEDIRPDITLIFDIDPKIGLARIKSEGEMDRIESEEIAFFERIRKYYLKCVKENSARYKLIDASQSLEKIKEEIYLILDKYTKKPLFLKR